MSLTGGLSLCCKTTSNRPEPSLTWTSYTGQCIAFLSIVIELKLDLVFISIIAYQVLFKDGIFQWKRLENLIVLAKENVARMSSNPALKGQELSASCLFPFYFLCIFNLFPIQDDISAVVILTGKDREACWSRGNLTSQIPSKMELAFF